MDQDAQQLARLRAAFIASDDPAPDPQSCPTPETLWSAVRGELPAPQLREVLDHVAPAPPAPRTGGSPPS